MIIMIGENFPIDTQKQGFKIGIYLLLALDLYLWSMDQIRMQEGGGGHFLEITKTQGHVKELKKKQKRRACPCSRLGHEATRSVSNPMSCFKEKIKLRAGVGDQFSIIM